MAAGKCSAIDDEITMKGEQNVTNCEVKRDIPSAGRRARACLRMQCGYRYRQRSGLQICFRGICWKAVNAIRMLRRM